MRLSHLEKAQAALDELTPRLAPNERERLLFRAVRHLVQAVKELASAPILTPITKEQAEKLLTDPKVQEAIRQPLAKLAVR